MGFQHGYLSQGFRLQLELLGVQGAQWVTWKTMRLGKATHMAGAGWTLHQILTAGDWRSEAVFRYVREEHADVQEGLKIAFDEDAEEPG